MKEIVINTNTQAVVLPYNVQHKANPKHVFPNLKGCPDFAVPDMDKYPRTLVRMSMEGAIVPVKDIWEDFKEAVLAKYPDAKFKEKV